jgi:transcriptional regulator with XRE-family HTH domain
LASRIVQLRRQRGWNQEELARRLGIPRDRLANWEAGRNTPTPEALLSLSLVLEASVDELLTGRRYPASGASVAAGTLEEIAEHVTALRDLVDRLL